MGSTLLSAAHAMNGPIFRAMLLTFRKTVIGTIAAARRAAVRKGDVMPIGQVRKEAHERIDSTVYAAVEANGPTSEMEIVRLCGFSRASVYRRLMRFHAEKRIHIAHWVIGKHQNTPMYAIGDKPDADAPPRRGHSRKQQRLMGRNPDERMPVVVEVVRHWQDVALFGPATHA